MQGAVMKPRGLLMIEHRLIEKMLKTVEGEIGKIRSSMSVDPIFIDTAVDFIRTYADRTHHGKEEDILFAELGRKNLDPENRRLMEELVREHTQGRECVRALVEAKESFLSGDKGAWETVAEKLQWLAEFYPGHIVKEDRDFFPKTEGYFKSSELEAMLSRFREFDANMIHEKYKRVVEELTREAPLRSSLSRA
jgi:hemerythrin-like domain-containing protein